MRSLHENYPPQMFYALMNLVGSHDRARVLNVLAGCPVKNAPKETWRTLRLDQAHYDMAKAPPEGDVCAGVRAAGHADGLLR